MSNIRQSPIMRQYLALKREIPTGAILLMRIGDFFEIFGKDAIVASPIINCPLTTRNQCPMCGFPYHRVDTMLARFVRGGKTVALAEEAEWRYGYDGIPRREIVRVVEP